MSGILNLLAAGGGTTVLTEDYTTADTMTWVTHTRTSNAMMFDSTGKLTFAPNNLITYSKDFTNAVWAAANGGTKTTGQTDYLGGSTAALITGNGSSNFSGINNTDSISRAQGGKYITSLYAKSGTASVIAVLVSGGNYGVLINLSDGTTVQNTDNTRIAVTTSSAGSGWWKISVLYTPTVSDGNSDCWFAPVTGSNNYVSSGNLSVCYAQVERVTYETVGRAYNATTSENYYGPRMDYNPVGPAKRGLLVEGQRTNLCTYSDYIHTGWNAYNCTPTASGGTGPDGLNSFFTFTEDTSTNSHAVYCPDLTSSAEGVVSCYIKGGTRRYVSMRGFNNAWVTIDTSDGSMVGNSRAVSYGSRDVGNSTWFVWMNHGTASGFTNLVIAGATSLAAPDVSSNVGESYTGTSKTWYVWGPQFEEGAFPTSYIPTATTSVTRNADSLTAALYTSNSVTEYYRLVSDLSRSSKTLNPFSGVSSETNIWVEKFTKP